MSSFVQQVIDDDTHAYSARVGGQPLPLAAAQTMLECDGAFVAGFCDLLAAHPFAAYFWETPVSTLATSAQPFRFVLARADALARTAADSSSFAAQLAGGADVVDFDNLGGDARLIVPCAGSAGGYAHLAAFVRTAPRAQQLALWRRVGQRWREATGRAPRWVSTAGLGVPWLHVRIDHRPKYYRHAAFRAV